MALADTTAAREPAARTGPYSPAQRALAMACGLVCHSVFAAAIACMIASLATGLVHGRGPFEGSIAVVANLLLALQFPLLHSWLLSERGSRWLVRLGPPSLGRDLATTSFAAVASVQLLVTFGLWSPSGHVWWRAEGPLLGVSLALYAGSWGLLLKAMWDAGLDLQSGFQGWGAVVRNRRPRWKPFPTRGLYRYTRQPIYLAFALTLWTGPVWTPDRLGLALGWTAYCLLGPRLKERRVLRREGDRYRLYQALVPYWLPRWRRGGLPDGVAPPPAAR